MRNKFKMTALILSVIALAFSGCTSSKKKASSATSVVTSQISSTSSATSVSASSSATSAGTSITSASTPVTSASSSSDISSSSSASSTSSTSSSSSSTSVVPPAPTGVTFSFSERVAEYVAKGYSGVVIPDYVCASSSATLTQPYPSEYPTYWLISNSNAIEMSTFISSFSQEWEDIVDSYGDHHLYLGSPLPGESCPYIYVGDYTAESLAGIVISFDEYTEPVPAVEFPLEEVNSYLTENDYGFTFSEADGEALAALSSAFYVDVDTYNGYPICQVTIVGEVFDAVSEIVLPVASSADYELYYEEEGYVQYANMTTYCSVIIEVDSGYTIVIFY